MTRTQIFLLPLPPRNALFETTTNEAKENTEKQVNVGDMPSYVATACVLLQTTGSCLVRCTISLRKVGRG